MIQSAPFPPSPLPQETEKLVILPLSDLHLPKAESSLIASNRAYLERIDFVSLLGDMVSCYATDTEYGAVREFITKLDKPYTPVCGNHEWYFQEFDESSGLYGEVWNQAADAEKRHKVAKFQAFYGVDELWRRFDSPLGRFVFLSLDRLDEEKQECLSDAQLEFLAAQLETPLPLFIFCHAPLMLDKRLDLIYYEEWRTACVELTGDLKARLMSRAAPSFWMSGHIHLHPSHYLFEPYLAGGNVWQIHCPDSWGYGRIKRQHIVPVRYGGPFSRHLEIDGAGVTFVSHNHSQQADTARYRVDF